MVIVQISGGLGNQLFQYAAGKALAYHRQVPVKLDITYLENDNIRKFELGNFTMKVEIAKYLELAPFKKKNLVRKAFQRLLPPYLRVPFKQPYFQYYTDFLKAPSTTYLKGTWQSEKYFLSIKDYIRSQFIIKPEIITQLKVKAMEIKQQNSVAVHVRRGDYLNPHILKYHGTLPKEYYQKALSIILHQHPFCTFYFFSDDIDWVKKNISVDANHQFISGNLTKNHFEDFYLMQQCKHNIIANSSFSWWCAWLNNNHEKMVIAPRKWFNKANYNTKDLLPNNWVRL